MKRVGLIGPPDRAELVRLAIRVEERGGEAVVVDSQQDPAIRIEPGSLVAGGVELDGLRAVYVSDLGIRSPWVRDADGRCDLAASEATLLSSRRHLAAWNALLARLVRDIPVVNPPQTHDLHALKPWEITVYEREGIPAPDTVATSDPCSLMALAADAGRQWIRKGMVGGYGYTEAFTPPADADEARVQLDRGPAMVQERVEGDNLRAFVLDDKVIAAAEIVSVAGPEVDSRRGESRLRRVTLPADAERAAAAAARRWGMPFCAVDFMRDAVSGRHLVLECNSAPFFVNFERRSGCDVSGPLADYLLKGGHDASTASRLVELPS